MRRCRGVSIGVCLILTTAFVLLTSRRVLLEQDSEYENVSGPDMSYQSENLFETEASPAPKTTDTTRIQRYVTPSLAELGDRGVTPRMNDHVLMVTRVPGAGAEILVLLLQRLQGYNAFKHIRLPRGDEGILTSLQQELLVEDMTSIIRQEAIPLTFDGDVRFLNFSAFGRQAPTYISLIRDPLDPKMIERFKRGGSAAVYKGSISHFCGHDSRCSERNNAWALERAKANVVRWYPVVGVLDRMEETVERLERTFPYFFEGASLVYDKLRPEKKNTDSVTIKPAIKKRLKNLLKTEIEFYEWIKFRLLNDTAENG